MQTIDEKPETIHLYVVREVAPQPSLLPIVLSLLALFVLVALSVVVPYQQPVTRLTLRVPAVLLPPKSFTVTTAIIPTGIEVYPATTAHGALTITNGSVIAQIIPQGFRLGNVITDSPVFVPAGSANGYGYATVAAHALVSGNAGNIPADSINQVEGSSVYIRNLSAFSGGRDSYAVKIVTAKDRRTALANARKLLSQEITGLHYPCTERAWSDAYQQVIWSCQYITYQVPAYMHISSILIIGKNLLLNVWFVACPTRLWVK